MAKSSTRARSTQPKTAVRSTSRPEPASIDSPACSCGHDSDASEAAEDAAGDEPEVRLREDIAKELERGERGGDYTRLPALGLQLALLRHLDEVTSLIVYGRVTTVAHVGQIAASLERFCCQCVERQAPRRSKWDDSLDWSSDEFDRGRLGEMGDDELKDDLNRFMDSALRRDCPELFEEAA